MICACCFYSKLVRVSSLSATWAAIAAAAHGHDLAASLLLLFIDTHVDAAAES